MLLFVALLLKKEKKLPDFHSISVLLTGHIVLQFIFFSPVHRKLIFCFSWLAQQMHQNIFFGPNVVVFPLLSCLQFFMTTRFFEL